MVPSPFNGNTLAYDRVLHDHMWSHVCTSRGILVHRVKVDFLIILLKHGLKRLSAVTRMSRSTMKTSVGNVMKHD